MKLRQSNLERLRNETFDVAIIGGGINGAVSAAALAARGARVALIDASDFAGMTSQNSSNLAWGGIKYLESMEFGLVRKLCLSRNALMRAYPSTVQEIRFFTTIERGFRHHRFILFLGAWLYWLIGTCFTRSPRLLSRRRIAHEEPIVSLQNSAGGFEYSDSYFHDNDARFVFNFVRSAMNYGCAAVNYLRAEQATFNEKEGMWTFAVKDSIAAQDFQLHARFWINACGPYVDDLNKRASQRTQHHHVFSKGIHLIVNRITPNKRVLTFFADDGRLFFVIPMGPRTCIGTTDTRVSQADVGVSDADRQFVLDNINKRLNLTQPLQPSDVIAERCGVRPLVVKGEVGEDIDWMQLSRKHVLETDATRHQLSIFGGKLTDCLNVGEAICEHLRNMGLRLPHPMRPWFGEPENSVRDEFFHQARLMKLDDYTHPSSSEPLSERLWRRYMANAFRLLEDIRADPNMAELLIEQAEYTRCEIEQSARREMITKLEDFLRRRSKIAQVIPHAELRQAEGLKEVCRIFFGAQADAKWREYFDSSD